MLVLEARESIGGGTRTTELTLPGFRHDVCSAIHPLAAGSPIFNALDLPRFGLEWIEPPTPLAHPLAETGAASLRREFGEQQNSLGGDAAAWSRLFRPFVHHWKNLAVEFLQPMLHRPRHPLILARFGWRALSSAHHLAMRRFRNEAARALFAGLAAHSFLPLEATASGAFGLVLGTAAHAVGWPFPRGGSQSIANALAAQLRQLGGEIETNHRVERLQQVPPAGAVLFDVTVAQFLRLAEGRLPVRYRSHLERFRPAPGVFKIDYALSAPVPWQAQSCREAGTVHVGGTLAEIAAAEREVAHGRHPEKPFVLMAQQSLFDSTRAPAGRHTLWAYCHVPNRSSFDMSARIEAQIERFAPGFRDCILARHSFFPADLERSNPNLIGGDINGGAANLWQLIARPTLSPSPYRTPLPGVYLCSSSTPPGGGVHGMCGYHAARTALRDVFRQREIPDLPRHF